MRLKWGNVAQLYLTVPYHGRSTATGLRNKLQKYSPIYDNSRRHRGAIAINSELGGNGLHRQGIYSNKAAPVLIDPRACHGH